MRKLGIVLGAGLLLLLVGTAASCGDSKIEQQRQAAVNQRANVFAQAEKVAPAPNSVNFPLRRALVEFTQREDLLNHPWYVYILADTGNVIGYYVAKDSAGQLLRLSILNSRGAA